jgi:hypothetical protein
MCACGRVHGGEGGGGGDFLNSALCAHMCPLIAPKELRHIMHMH